MAEYLMDVNARALMREMRIDDVAIERRQKMVALGEADLARITAVNDLVRAGAERYTASFFEFLGGFDEAKQLLGRTAIADRARQLKKDHLVALASGSYGATYVEQRVELGLLYAKAGIDQRLFLGAYHHMLRNIGADIVKNGPPDKAFDTVVSVQKVGSFDVALIADVLVFERERVIRQQQEAIRELSTPVLQIRDRLLLLPLIGVIDTRRARDITENVLKAIRANRAKVVVMDVTGVAAIDSRVAHHIMQTVAAAALMGARVIVTGISSEVAQALVALGIELSMLTTVGDLQGGLEEAERVLGYTLVKQPAAAPIRAS
jgi:rsbT co-antagonist protein RsbR